MPPILQQKSSFISLILLGIGVYCHVKGRNLSTDTTALVTQFVGVLFDVLAGNVAWFAALHQRNAQHIQDNRAVINVVAGNAEPTASRVAPLPPVPGTQPVSKEASRATGAIPISKGLVFTLLLMGASLCSGCQALGIAQPADDRTKVYQMEQVFNAMMQGLIGAYQGGLIDDAKWKQLDPFVQAANSAFKQLDADVSAGVKIDGTEAFRAATAAMDQLTLYKWSVPNGNSSTRPVGAKDSTDLLRYASGWRDRDAGAGASRAGFPYSTRRRLVYAA